MISCLSLYRHLLVPLLFHEVTSLYPLHFREMIFQFVPIPMKGLRFNVFVQTQKTLYIPQINVIYHWLFTSRVM